MSKGSRVRPCTITRKEYEDNYEHIFGIKQINVWRDLPNGIQGNAGDRTRDQSDSGRATGVPKEPGGAPDSQTAEPVEPPPRGNRQAPPGEHPLDTDYWTWSGYRGEYTCPHGVGHGNHIHGCCPEQCCSRADFPLQKDKK